VYLLLVNCKFNLTAANFVICEPTYLQGKNFSGKKWSVYMYAYIYIFVYIQYIGVPVCMRNTFNDLSQLHETADNTERYI
jgi:hypothetical protein